MVDKKNAIVQIFIPAKGWEQEAHLNWQNNEVINLRTIFIPLEIFRINF